jgi:hypothetical protein
MPMTTGTGSAAGSSATPAASPDRSTAGTSTTTIAALRPRSKTTPSPGPVEDGQFPTFPRLDNGNHQTVAEELIDLALKLAGEGFDEHVDALVKEAENNETELALAAAQVSTEPPMQSGSVDQIAYSLLVEAFQRASTSAERSSR